VARYDDISPLLSGLLTTLRSKTKELDVDDAEDERLTDRLLFYVFLDTHVGIDILRQYRRACRDNRVFRREIVYLYLLRMETSAADFVAGWGLDAIKDALDSIAKYEYAEEPTQAQHAAVTMLEADSGAREKVDAADYADDDDECEVVVLNNEGKANQDLTSLSGHKRHTEWTHIGIMDRIKRVSLESHKVHPAVVTKHETAHKYCDKVLQALLIIKENLTNYNSVDNSNADYKQQCAEQMEWFATHFCLLISMRTEIIFPILHLYDSVLTKQPAIAPSSPLGTFVMLRFFTLTHLKMLRHQISARMLP